MTIFKAARWNNDRGLDTWQSNLSIKILSEEVREFWKAYAEDSIVDMLDAYADVRFVHEGRLFLFSVTKFESIEALRSATTDYELVYTYGVGQLNLIGEILTIGKGLSQANLDYIYDIVCEVNDLKHKERDANGKITKGPNWYPPENRIREYLNSLNINIGQNNGIN